MKRVAVLSALVSILFGTFAGLAGSGIALAAPPAIVPLSAGPNWVTLPRQPLAPLTAESWCQLFNSPDQGGPGAVTFIRRWDGSLWTTHPCGLPFGDFPIELGRGYEVRVAEGHQFVWKATGTPLTSPVSLTLNVGFTLVGLPETSVNYTAASLCQAMNASAGPGTVTEVRGLVQGQVVIHTCGMPSANFPTSHTKGYFIKSASPFSFTPQ